jgi:hypothetical protein
VNKKQSTKLKNNSLTQLLAVGSLAIGVAASIPAAPAHAIAINSGSLIFSDGAFSNFPITGTSGNGFSVTFNAGSLATVTTANGDFGSLIPGVSPIQSVAKPVNPSIGNFLYSNAVSPNTFDYRLTNPGGLDFNFGTTGNLNIAANSIFRGSFDSNDANFSLLNGSGSTFTNAGITSPIVLNDLDFSVRSAGIGASGSYGVSVASVPEPFTIIGTLVGGTAAFRMRKKLSAANKK